MMMVENAFFDSQSPTIFQLRKQFPFSLQCSLAVNRNSCQTQECVGNYLFALSDFGYKM